MRIFASVIALALLATPALAQTRKPENSTFRVGLSSDFQTEWFVDTNRLTSPTKTIRRVWVFVVNNGRDVYTSGKTVKQFIQYDCANQTIGIVAIVRYDSTGQVIGSEQTPKPEMGIVTPNTLGEHTMKFACGPIANWLSGEFPLMPTDSEAELVKFADADYVKMKAQNEAQ